MRSATNLGVPDEKGVQQGERARTDAAYPVSYRHANGAREWRLSAKATDNGQPSTQQSLNSRRGIDMMGKRAGMLSGSTAKTRAKRKALLAVPA